MKRLLSLLFVVVLVLSLCACAGGSGAAGGKKSGLYVGFGRENITPDYTVHMSGGDWKSRTSSGYMDTLYVTCVAITEGDQTLLLYTMDFIGASDTFVDPARQRISEATGVPVENIWMNATHTHSGVAISSNWDKTQMYRDMFNEAATKAATDAIADQAKAEVYYGGIQTEKMAFVRHYTLSNGTVAGSNFGNFNSGAITGHVVDADTELQLINFVREGEEKKDILLMSFPAHCTMNQKSEVLSADYPAPTREYIEANSNHLVAFFQGASGDQVPISKVGSENYSTDYRVYGERLGQYALDGIPSLTKAENTKLKLVTEVFVGDANKENIDRLDDAQKVQAVINQYSKSSEEAKAAASQYGFSSVYEATAIISRASSPDTGEMELRAFCIGDVGVVLAPYEMFCKHSMYIKEHSPFPETFMITIGQGSEGYLPTLEAFEYGSYEACVSNYARGTGEILMEKFVELLAGLKTEE